LDTPHLDEVVADDLAGCPEILQVFIGVNPEAALAPQKIAQDTLSASQVQGGPAFIDGKTLIQKLDFLFFLDGFPDEAELPGEVVHGPIILGLRPENKKVGRRARVTRRFSKTTKVRILARHGFLSERITMHHYEARHMMYLHRPSLDKLLADVRASIESGKK